MDIGRQMKEDSNWMDKNRIAGMQFVGEADGACSRCNKYLPTKEAQRRLNTITKKFFTISVSRNLCSKCEHKRFLDPSAAICPACASLTPKIRAKPHIQEVQSTQGILCESCARIGPDEPDEFDNFIGEIRIAAKAVCKDGDRRDIDDFLRELQYHINALQPKTLKPSHKRILEEAQNIHGMVEGRIRPHKVPAI